MIRRMRGMAPEDVYALKGVSDPRLSPDGTTVAYVVWHVDEEANEYRGNVWLAPVDASEPPRRFTTGERRNERELERDVDHECAPHSNRKPITRSMSPSHAS